VQVAPVLGQYCIVTNAYKNSCYATYHDAILAGLNKSNKLPPLFFLSQVTCKLLSPF